MKDSKFICLGEPASMFFIKYLLNSLHSGIFDFVASKQPSLFKIFVKNHPLEPFFTALGRRAAAGSPSYLTASSLREADLTEKVCTM
jgi:hypothetical protein